MDGNNENRKGHYEEFGVESVAPDDDFAYWATLKRREQERRKVLDAACRAGCEGCCSG